MIIINVLTLVRSGEQHISFTYKLVKNPMTIITKVDFGGNF